MQFTTSIVYLLASAAALVAAVPVEGVVAETEIVKISEVTVMLDRAQCSSACRGGASAMKVFCRFIPHPIAKVACSVAAAGLGTSVGQDLCADFCDKFF